MYLTKPFFVVEGDTSRNTTESEANYSTPVRSFETPAIFSIQGSKQYNQLQQNNILPQVGNGSF